MDSIYTIAKQFQIKSDIIEITPWGNGLVNHTYRIYTASGEDYLLQEMNTYAYKDIPGEMENIYAVTQVLNAQQFYLSNGEPKVNISLILQKDGKLFHKTADGRYYRCYNFIKHTCSIEKAETPHQAYLAGEILGQFHYLLRDFPVATLHVTNPGFHDTAMHYRNLLKAAEEDIMGRRHEVEEELAFFEAYKDLYPALKNLVLQHKIPLHVTHNDTKINNFMFAESTGESICMVDLDTLMPGVIATDFGDAIRSIMCTGKDEGIHTDISKTTFRQDLYDSYYEAFLLWTGEFLTQGEIETLSVGAKLVCLESGMRYLTDYLKGDLYLKIHYDKQNLIKTRMHIQLVKDMMSKL